MTHFRRCLAPLAVLAAVLCPESVSAQNTSTTQMSLINSTRFLDRLAYLGWGVATEVLVEPALAAAAGPIPAYTTGCHTARLAFARFFLADPQAGARAIAIGVSQTNASGAVIVGSVTGTGLTADSTATDGQVAQAIRVNWNSVSSPQGGVASGCFANP